MRLLLLGILMVAFAGAIAARQSKDAWNFSDEEEAAQRGVTVSTTQVRSNGVQLAELGRLLDTRVVRVAVDSTFPLADARQAHERAARGNIQGKIVLTVA